MKQQIRFLMRDSALSMEHAEVSVPTDTERLDGVRQEASRTRGSEPP